MFLVFLVCFLLLIFSPGLFSPVTFITFLAKMSPSFKILRFNKFELNLYSFLLGVLVVYNILVCYYFDELPFGSLMVFTFICLMYKYPEISTHFDGVSIFSYRLYLYASLLLFCFVYSPISLHIFNVYVDKNAVAIFYLPFFLALIYRGGIIDLVAVGSFSFYIDARLMVICVFSFYIYMLFSLYLERKKLVIKNNMIIMSVCFIILVLNLIIVCFVVLYNQDGFTFSMSRGLFDVMDASNFERYTSIYNTVLYFYNNPLFFFLGDKTYAYYDVFNTYAHNDFLQYIVKHGFVLSFLLYVFLFRAYIKSGIPFVFLLSYVCFSSLLGGILWTGGFYFLVVTNIMLIDRLNEHSQ